MNNITKQIDRLLEEIKNSTNDNISIIYMESRQLLRDYAGVESTFYEEINEAYSWNNINKKDTIVDSLKGFKKYIDNGLFKSISPKRQAEIDVVSDFLEQAKNLLQDSRVHPAAPAVLIGASLEEFLRNWIEDEKIELGNLREGIDSYAKLLREKDLITKQDKKDIDAWAGNRNNAAHGHWDEIKDRTLVNIMLQAVNLFMRKYSPETRIK